MKKIGDKYHLTSLQTICFTAIVSVFFLQLYWLNPYVSTWDQADFSFAVERFDLMKLQPHFPGYPYFILGGKILRHFTEKPNEALVLFNILLYLSAIYPIYKLAKLLHAKYPFLIVAMVYTSSYTVTMVNQPISEGSALAVMWWYILSIVKGVDSKRITTAVWPLFFLSLLLGIRLSYLPLAVGVLYLFYVKWKKREFTYKQILILTLIGIIFQSIWLIGLIVTEGSLVGFIKLSLAFTSGHFQEWGGSIGSSEVSMPARIHILIFQNIIWAGISAEYLLLLTGHGIFLAYFSYLTVKKRWQASEKEVVMILLTAAYFLWSLLAQNIDKPRHSLPSDGLILFLLYVQLLKYPMKNYLHFPMVFLIIFQVYAANSLMKEQSSQKPAVYQMAQHLEETEGPIIVYTWEETRVLEYLDVPFAHKRLQTYEHFKQDARYYKGRDIYLTNKVVEGFQSQGVSPKEFKKIKQFNSNELFDPVYHQITLYKWNVAK